MNWFARNNTKKGLTVTEIALFAMLGSLMFAAQVVMEVLPNIHLSGMFVILYTVLFRYKALIPIYLYVFLIGVRWGFGISWIPYLYLWLILWALVMLVPKRTPRRLKMVLFPLIGGTFGLCFGTLYAPAQALLFHLSFEQTLLWIAAGFPWDVVHACGNVAFCTLVVPLSEALRRVLKKTKVL
ncbi:MAG: hypothetical protein E7580_06445 [Ruminococcaceae bacterium]|nr:hypothetical protein [Oscillospiraceae bacterium]